MGRGTGELVICHRETPLSLIEIENMATVTRAGGIIAPLNPGFYLKPTGIDDLVDFMAARILDVLGGMPLTDHYSEWDHLSRPEPWNPIGFFMSWAGRLVRTTTLNGHI